MRVFAAWHDEKQYSVIVAESEEEVFEKAKKLGVFLVRVTECPKKTAEHKKIRFDWSDE